MDTIEGGALVEDNRSSGVGERQGFQPRMRGATQTLLPFPGIARPLERPNFTDWEFLTAKKRLVDQGVGAVRFGRGKKGNVEGVWSKCKWCNNIYGTNIIRLTQHFTCDFSLKNRSMPELPAYKKEGSKKHIRGCSSVPEEA
ncbi:hypothetical protein R1flu_023525 [Riccia fluitans]|uniref:BED-type domain-containing protein n=1 Tax=Riccia fluitans TaxID=41844 RepID=A0ABD1XWC0_9MARC